MLAPFALLWALMGSASLPSGSSRIAMPAAVVLAAAAVVLALVRRTGPERERRQPEGWHERVGLVNLGELAAIFVTVTVCSAFGRPQLVPPVVCLVVAVHFVPLARLFDQPEYRGTAAGLAAASVAGLAALALGSSAETSRLLVGAVAALTLWVTSLLLSLRPTGGPWTAPAGAVR